jgi:hypothetical protein
VTIELDDEEIRRAIASVAAVMFGNSGDARRQLTVEVEKQAALIIAAIDVRSRVQATVDRVIAEVVEAIVARKLTAIVKAEANRQVTIAVQASLIGGER